MSVYMCAMMRRDHEDDRKFVRTNSTCPLEHESLKNKVDPSNVMSLLLRKQCIQLVASRGLRSRREIIPAESAVRYPFANLRLVLGWLSAIMMLARRRVIESGRLLGQAFIVCRRFPISTTSSA